MSFTARLLTLLAVIFAPACVYIGPGSRHPVAARPAAEVAAPTSSVAPIDSRAASSTALPADPHALQASPRRLVGRILTVDATRGFALVNLTSDPPAAALADGTELLVRTDDLRERGRLQASRYIRGRTLGAKIISGQPSPGDEVVFQSP